MSTKAEIIQDLKSEGMKHTTDLFFRKSKTAKTYRWISMPEIHQKSNGDSYIFALHKEKHSDTTLWESVDQIINKYDGYKKHIKRIGKTTNDVKYKKMIHHEKRKQKYIKKGTKIGLKNGFRKGYKKGRKYGTKNGFGKDKEFVYAHISRKLIELFLKLPCRIWEEG
eukprot:280400_1